MQIGYSCTCNSGTVADMSQVFMQGCAYAARIVRLHAQMQESTCARKAASTHARLHVCTQELHDCMHTRELDLCCHAQSAHELKCEVVVSSSSAQMRGCSLQPISAKAALEN